uniref:Golgin subfamily A member 7/ERF4 domain-containing protein n=1 Tax=Panagrolaimus sp. JU765 TaxID=591449 RepID=A0AC34QVH1_9BILA
MDQQISLNSCRKVYIERDYSKGTGVAFNTDFPVQLGGMIDKSDYENTIRQINSLFDEVEQVCLASVLETLVGCGTCYLNRFFTATRYEKQLEKIRDYIDNRNKNIFIPSGLYLMDPKEKGLRVLEISLLATGKAYPISLRQNLNRDGIEDV